MVRRGLLDPLSRGIVFTFRYLNLNLFRSDSIAPHQVGSWNLPQANSQIFFLGITPKVSNFQLFEPFVVATIFHLYQESVFKKAASPSKYRL